MSRLTKTTIALNKVTNTEDSTTPDRSKPLPFINWVGGKRKLTDQLISLLPTNTYLNNYYEPFLGGGALFFSLKGKFNKYFLSDINLDLVTSYNSVKKNPIEVNRLFENHKQNHSKEYYYHVRSVCDSSDPTAITARFIYLNRYSFKGIYRITKSGNLDMSFSYKDYKGKDFATNIQNVSRFFDNTMIYTTDYSFINAGKNDFVYLDPPYHKAGERFYTRLPFDESEQVRLKDFVSELDSKGVKVMISNSNTDFIRDLYRGYRVKVIEVRYSIRDKRETGREVVVMNY